MQQTSVIEFHPKRGKPAQRKRDPLNTRKKGSVISRGGKLWVSFHYLGQRVREPSGLNDTAANRLHVRKQLDLVVAEIANGVFEFAKRFPHSKKNRLFAELEGGSFTESPDVVLFGDYVVKWLQDMGQGMTPNRKRDFVCSLNNHVLPYFKDVPFGQMRPILMKKFVALLISKKNHHGEPLSPKTIRNYLIPLREIIRDARDEYGWYDMVDPFRGLRLPRVRNRRIQPLNFQEWLAVQKNMFYWYRPFFEFAVQTGLRPSEQVALRWTAIDGGFLQVELSRVRNFEKADLKTATSFRRIELRTNMRKTLERQKELTKRFDQPYVFLTSEGIPVRQENLGKIWTKALKKAGVPHRRMYETRHTFASWALAAGESSEWVARTLGHVDTTMVYRVYGRYIPNLTRQDGSAFERQYSQTVEARVAEDVSQLKIGTILGTIGNSVL